MLSGSAIVLPDNSTATNQNPSTAPVVVEAPSSLNSNDGVQQAVARKFSTSHILYRIAFCESTYAQYDRNGNVLRGVVNSKDVGVFQINERYHKANAERMGIDLYTPEGNLEYAEYLYNRDGARPWSSSKPCWGRYLVASNN
ncbi:MAG: hypothetical protein RJB39_208 [Candidatus Parcubacteria bacterium]